MSSPSSSLGTLGTTAQDPSLLPIPDIPNLPRVLIIGDSISMGYTLPVREFLQGRANVHRIPENGNSTTVGLNRLSDWLGARAWDIIHFNWGLHDLKHVRNDCFDLTAPIQTTKGQYRSNLARIVTCLKATGAHLIWASTTPVPQNCAGRVAGDDVIYNDIAKNIMKPADIPINDLHTLAVNTLSAHQRPEDVHFNSEGSRILGEQVARYIASELDRLS